MWNFIKTVAEFIDRLTDMQDIKNPNSDAADRIRKDVHLVPVRVLHDGKHPNTSGRE